MGRRRGFNEITAEEKTRIHSLWEQGYSCKEIADTTEVHPSMVRVILKKELKASEL